MPSNNFTPPSSTSSNSASPQDPVHRVVRRRNRVPLSCAPCRHRKLKCNRGHPCDNCTKRGDLSSCSYAAPKPRKSSANGSAGQTPDDMQGRINKLERLVMELMDQNGGNATGTATARAVMRSSRSTSTSTGLESSLDVEGADLIQEEGPDAEDDSEVERVSKGLGVMKMDGNKSMYASDTHWYAILAEINEVKQFFTAHRDELQKQYAKVRGTSNSTAAYLFQGGSVRDKNELLESFPSKEEADRIVLRYFSAYDPAVHVVHGPTFQKAYDAHWNNPENSPAAWLGMCYAMMTLALQSYGRSGDEPAEYKGRSTQLADEYRRLTAQCLIMADLTQPISQILETLILYTLAEYGRSRDAEPGVLLMTSLCVRLAMRMGYHRDPGPHAQITPFQGEMRRRVWAQVRKQDLMISFQFGVPAMIRADQTDTKLPLNLYDDELQDDMKALPIARPSFQVTEMTYMIAKSNITYVFGKIAERVQSISNQPSYEETMQLDQELRRVRSTHPQVLQMRPFEIGAKDPANTIMQRIGLELIYLRSLFVLHRRFIARARGDPRFAYSRRTCIDASMEMLSHQATLHEESHPGGRLRGVKWYISSLTTHDFLLAAGLVCLDLYHVSQAERRNRQSSQPQSPTSHDTYVDERKEAMMGAVAHCIKIWEEIKDASMEAYKASSMLKILLDKIRRAFSNTQSPNQSRGFTYANHSPGYGFFPNNQLAEFNKATADLAPEQSAAMTLGMLSGTMSPIGAFGVDTKAYPASMAGILNEPVAERTGLTPLYSGDLPGSGLTGGTSPFSGMFGGGFNSMDALGATDMDWNAWNDFVLGNAPVENQAWPMNVEASEPATQQQPASTSYPGIFMGAGTPQESRMA